MIMTKTCMRCLLTLTTSALIATSTQAAPIFTENFNSYTGNQNTTQYQTGLKVAHTGSVAGWTKSGSGTMHAVDLANGAGGANPADWAIMFFQNNVITLSTGIAANDNGMNYEVTFNYGTAVYGTTLGGPGQRTLAGDGLKVEVLRADNSVLASQSYLPGAWDTSGNQNLDAGLIGTLSYVGDGSGAIRLRIGPDGTLNSGRFEGTIDNISVDVVPEPSSLALLGLGSFYMLRRRRI